MEIISTKEAPAAIGPYSQAIVSGNLIYTSGQIPINPASGNIEACKHSPDSQVQEPTVIPISEDPDAVELPLPGKNETESLETEVQEIEE